MDHGGAHVADELDADRYEAACQLRREQAEQGEERARIHGSTDERERHRYHPRDSHGGGRQGGADGHGFPDEVSWIANGYRLRLDRDVFGAGRSNPLMPSRSTKP